MKVKLGLGSIIFNIFNYTFLGILVIATLFPFLHIISVSLSTSAYVSLNKVFIWPIGINLDSYKYVLKEQLIMLGYKNTIVYTGVGTFLNLLLTAMTAYSLANRKMIFRKFLTFIITFTMLFGGGLIPNYLLVQKLNLLNTIWAVILPVSINTWYLLVMRTFFLGIPYELEESATIDGCNSIMVFIKIILPLSKASLATIGLFYAVSHWNSFFLPLLYLNDRNKYPLQIILRSMVIEGNLLTEQPIGNDETNMMVVQTIKYTVIVVATLPILCVYPFIQKYFIKGVMVGSLKG